MKGSKISLEICGVFYESINHAARALKSTYKIIKRRCLSDKFTDYKIVPFRVTYTEKRCIKCGEIKQFKEFCKDKKTKDGFVAECRQCRALYRREHKKEREAYQKEWNKDNPNYHKQYAKEWNSKRINKNKINQRLRERRETDIIFRLNTDMAAVIRRSLKGNKNGKHWEDLAGYSCEELIAHLKKTIPKGYTWDDYLTNRLHLDHHPIPLYWFVFETPKDKGFKKAWALNNLRLFPALENIRKGNKLFYT